jgi:peptidoglycan/xylan/chitin deacetylase (PgdA/CDA1 family)
LQVDAKARARSLALRAAGSAPFAAIVGLLERLDGSRTDLLPVLMYHRIGVPAETPELDPSLVSASPAQFSEQMAYLGARRRPIGLEELLAVRAGEAPLPPRAVLVTFDDAYRDFADHAWPIMRRHAIPVTLFVPTAYPDAPDATFWWDRLFQALSMTREEDVETPVGHLSLGSLAAKREAMRVITARVKALPHPAAMELVEAVWERLGAPTARNAVLGWEELRRLAAEGVSLAPHSRTHALLDRVPPDVARDEILGSASDLEREVGHSPPVFALPAGGHSAEVVRILADAGFAAAFTILRGTNDLRRADWLRLRRINVGARATLPLVRAQLLSSYARFSRHPTAETAS